MHTANRQKSIAGIGFILLLSLACSLPGLAQTTPEVPGNAEVPQDAILENPLANHAPIDLADAVRRGVKSKKWTLEQGIILALQELTGETDPTVETQPPLTGELTSLTRMARGYLQTGEDAQAKAEITRLLAILSPDPATLDAYSKPEGTTWRSPVLASPARQLDCDTLADRGFPTDTPTTCFLYRSFSVGGDTYKIFYPYSWTTDAPQNLARLDQAVEATTKSVNTYNALGGRVGSAYLVFSLLDIRSGGRDDIPADASPTFSSTPACKIVVYPLGITDFDAANFEQMLAHEFFHCYQFANLGHQINDPDASATDWWTEGSAQFFSNVVYPDVNLEADYLGDFVYRSETTSLVDMSYEDYLFFQYLENRFGVDGVLRFLTTLPTGGGRQQQLESLSSYPDMQQLFNDFARTFIDSQVIDQSGDAVVIPLDQAEGTQVILVTDTMEQTFEADPFVLRRARISFMPGKRYEVQVSVDAGDGLNAARPTGDVSEWTSLTEVTESGCPPAAYVTALTTSDPVEAYDVKVDVQATGDTGADLSGCTDRCLIGKWVLDDSSYEQYFNSTTPAGLDYKGTSGVMDMSFTQHNDLSGNLLDFSIKFTDQVSGLGGPPIVIDVLIKSNGSGTAFYWADGRILGVSSTDFGFALDGSATVNGASYPFGGNLDSTSSDPSSVFAGGRYFCKDDRLLYTPPVEGMGLGALTYNRVSGGPQP